MEIALPGMAGTSPEIALSKLHFPAPFAPRITQFSPGSTERLTPSSARWCP